MSRRERRSAAPANVFFFGTLTSMTSPSTTDAGDSSPGGSRLDGRVQTSRPRKHPPPRRHVHPPQLSSTCKLPNVFNPSPTLVDISSPCILLYRPSKVHFLAFFSLQIVKKMTKDSSFVGLERFDIGVDKLAHLVIPLCSTRWCGESVSES